MKLFESGRSVPRRPTPSQLLAQEWRVLREYQRVRRDWWAVRRRSYHAVGQMQQEVDYAESEHAMAQAENLAFEWGSQLRARVDRHAHQEE